MSLHDVPWHCDTLLIDVYRMVRSLEACYTRSTSKSTRGTVKIRGNDSLINSSRYRTDSYLFLPVYICDFNDINLDRNARGVRAWNFRAHTRGGCHGIQNAWNAREMDGVEQALVRSHVLLEILVSCGEGGA